MKVAIIQDRIIPGGRMVVINEVIAALNEMGIVPDILTFHMSLSRADIQKKYQKEVDFKVRPLGWNIFHKLPEINKLWFNLLTRWYGRRYDLLINSNNTECMLTSRRQVISYVHYPRLDRLRKNMTLHVGEKKDDRQWSARFAEKFDHVVSRFLYRFCSAGDNIHYIANSCFTRQALLANFNLEPSQVQVIYPPVDMEAFDLKGQKKPQVATIGRFSSAKRQLEQIEIAARLPELHFAIMGFAGKGNSYFEKCKAYIDSHQIGNVTLYPDLSFSAMVKQLEASKFFLHTTRNEPFGITTVQGIAAGCIPVTHNSGGQKEIVFPEELRFDNKQEAVEIFKRLIGQDLQSIYAQLAAHIRNYTTKRFRQGFSELIEYRNPNN